MQNKREIQWQPIVELIVVLMTILGSTIPLYIHTDNKLGAFMKDVQEERKDFHEKIYNLEKSFQERLLKIEMDRKK